MSGAGNPGCLVIVVADDSPTVRAAVARQVVRLGHRALPASDGTEVLSIVEDQPKVDVVVLDLVMPELDGAGALVALRNRDPGCRVVLMTGCDDEEIERRLGGARPDALLRKPFSLSELAASLRP